MRGQIPARLAHVCAALVIVVCARAAGTHGAVIYVDADAGGANNGQSWADAFRYLQDAHAAERGRDVDRPVLAAERGGAVGEDREFEAGAAEEAVLHGVRRGRCVRRRSSVPAGGPRGNGRGGGARVVEGRGSRVERRARRNLP